MGHEASHVMEALAIIEDAWGELRTTPYVQQQLGIMPAGLCSISLKEAQRRSDVGRSLLSRLHALQGLPLSHELTLSLRLVEFRARIWSKEANWYWLVVDPLGVGFFGLFLPTAYCGGYLLSTLHDQLSTYQFGEPGDVDRYFALISDYARLIGQFTERTEGQAARGILMPAPQILQARELLSRFKSGVQHVLRPKSVDALSAETIRELKELIARDVEPAFDRALAGLSDGYLGRAPEQVGISQYPGGAELYEDLVKLHTTLDLSPAEVHQVGYRRMQEIEDQMEVIRSALGFRNDKAGFLTHIDQDRRWRASTSEGVEAVFRRYAERLEPKFDHYFPVRPKAPCRTAALPESLQDGMTFGYYDAPTKGREEGIYLFNAKNLTSQALIHIGALTYHELSPGHHLHLSLLQENKALHPFRVFNYVNAFNEAWAEYAANLAGEIGLYQEPEERYGRLVMDAFLTSRLVVDTGMNALGWSLERARDYMRAHSGMTDVEIKSETLRYSCDLPAQALAYKLGDTRLHALRERCRHARGPAFTIREFHSAVLGVGAVPFAELEWHLEHVFGALPPKS